ncbi:MAG: MmcQ/YjbR family DNA-binding protein [Cyclobacteriaceae bacterium]|nr:MmcQ/YjbR family DNA-binding protein [Cyclobacteriaceae bacterium HetDA_MAG_MS6]
MNIEQLREYCLSLPCVREDVKWGNDLCFLIGEKMFCVTGLDGMLTASLKVADDERPEILAMDGIVPAPYLARYGWVKVERGSALTEEEWKKYVLAAYHLVRSKLPKKVKDQLK